MTRRLAASTAVFIVGAPSLAYYLKVVRPRALYQEHMRWINSVPPPHRRTPVFMAGNEPMLSLRDAARVANSDLFKTDSVFALAVFYVRVAWRMAVLAFSAFPVALLYLCARYRLLGVSYDLAHVALRDLLGALGPSFIKLGQWAATRPDFFGNSLTKTLGTLFDSAPPHSWEGTMAALKRDGVLDHITDIDPVPLNSGSVAQVHRAVLKRDYVVKRSQVDAGTIVALNTTTERSDEQGNDDVVVCKAGTPLVLKVMHPGVRELMLADSCVLRFLGSVVSWFVPGAEYMSLQQTAEEVSGLAVSQLDLEREADNLIQFRYNFRDPPTKEGTSQVIFPVPLTGLSNRDVLVETYEVGEKISDENLTMYAPMGHIAVNMFMKMIFVDNLVHADLHPGNMMFRVKNPDGSLTTADRAQKGCIPQLVVLDPGLVTSLSERERRNFVQLFAAVASGDGELGAQLMHDFSPEPNRCTDVNKFKADMRAVFDAICPAKIGFNLAEISIGEKLTNVMEAMRDNKVRVDMNFATLVATVVVGEGMGRRLLGDFNIVEEALPFLLTCLQSQELDFLAKKLQETYLTVA